MELLKVIQLPMLGQVLGIYAVAIAGGLALDPAIGGILDGLWGWRSIFLINILPGILSFILLQNIRKGRIQEGKMGY
ncbi:hypothetical protein [Methanobacterium sp. SMA-27]|uniref:hypothetical protein n=1 Tax=Methanobacterium sp. SMA-27 TaxID=1495336 RepID=UPI001E4064B9|nr:hypothetical protein [Methanobacterium sp. SMA-27]